MNEGKTASAKALAIKLRSTYPRAPKHGKHAEIQGFPNTRGMNTTQPQRRKKR